MESLIKSRPAECIKLWNIKHSIQFAVAILELLLLYNSAVNLPGVSTICLWEHGNFRTERITTSSEVSMLRSFIEMIISFEFDFDYLGSVPKPTKPR